MLKMGYFSIRIYGDDDDDDDVIYGSRNRALVILFILNENTKF